MLRDYTLDHKPGILGLSTIFLQDNPEPLEYLKKTASFTPQWV
jgi:hypothetical protein